MKGFIFFYLILSVANFYNRKDSFITHRAFCDALAEESTRFTSIQIAVNLNNLRNQLINGGISTNLQQQQQQMSGNISQLMGLGSLDPSNQLNLDHGQKSRLPLWLHHDNSNYGKYISSAEFSIYISESH